MEKTNIEVTLNSVTFDGDFFAIKEAKEELNFTKNEIYCVAVDQNSGTICFIPKRNINKIKDVTIESTEFLDNTIYNHVKDCLCSYNVRKLMITSEFNNTEFYDFLTDHDKIKERLYSDFYTFSHKNNAEVAMVWENIVKNPDWGFGKICSIYYEDEEGDFIKML